MAELDDKVIVTKDKITTIADTIREEGGTSARMTLDEMPDNIRAIGGGGSADVKRLGITLANNTATFNLNGYEIWQLIGSNKTIVADITYTDGNNSTSYNKSCTASLKSEASDTQTRIEASVMIYKNYTFYTRYFNMVIGASSMEYTGTYAVTDIVIPEEQYIDPLFTFTYPNTITCNKTFAEISLYYGVGNTRPVAPQLIYKHSSDDDTAFRSVYGEVEQYDEDTFIFKFNMGYARGVGKTQWQERIIEIQFERGDSLSKIADYTLEYQKPVVAGDGIELENVGTGINRKTQISVADALMIIGESSGSIASFDDGGNDMPLKSCIVAIEPVQSGSGDPSPSNVRPITGWTEANLDVKGANIVNVLSLDGHTSGTYNNVDYTVSNGVVTLNGQCSASGNINITTTLYLKGGQKYSMCDFAEGTFPSNSSARLQLYKANAIDINTLNNSASNYVVSGTCQMSTNVTLRIRVASGHNYSNCKLKPMIAVGEVSAMDYATYQGNTYNIEFPSEAGTVYGGTLDVINGVLMVTDGYIASYNGETLPSTWISSMDVYAEGTTPTTGAEVVYKLATPQTYNLTPTEVKTLLGINNIFADCGDVDVEYVRDATLIINKLLELVSGNNNRTMMKSAVVEKTDEVQEQKKESVEKKNPEEMDDLDA